MVLDSFIAIPNNKAVKDMPLKKETQGTLSIIPGTNRLITKEPKAIFAASKKKSQVTLDLSLISIKNKSTMHGRRCQGTK